MPQKRPAQTSKIHKNIHEMHIVVNYICEFEQFPNSMFFVYFCNPN